MLKLNSKGPVVRELQNLLRLCGYNLAADGHFGKITERAVLDFQGKSGLLQDGIAGPKTLEALRERANGSDPEYTFEVHDCYLPSNEYFPVKVKKSQIVLHHTADNDTPENVIRKWTYDKVRIATAFLIGQDGRIVRAFSEDHWAWHLGVSTSNYRELNAGAIGIEICSFGWLKPKNGKFYAWTGKEISPDMVIDYGPAGFRGARYYERYTDAQIEAVRKLVLELSDTYGIPIEKRNYSYPGEWWNVSQSALSGKSGLWHHCNYRRDKSDLHPQPEMIKMLNSL